MRIEGGSMKQSRLEDFSEMRESKSWQEIDEHNRLAMKRIHRNHIAKMSDILNEVFSRLFDGDQYIEGVENVENQNL